MEPITVAVTIATLFFSESLKEGGKALGAGVSKSATQLITAVRNKFTAVGTEGLLARAEKQPTETNVNLVQGELVVQMQEDKEFAAELQDLLAQLEMAGVVRQVMATGLRVAGTLEAEDMSQEATGRAKQEMLTDVEAQNIKLGNLTQTQEG